MSQLKNIQIATPTYTDEVPSTGTKVKMTPFRVADEKALLIASESKDTKQMINALKSVIGNCVEGMPVDDMATFDLEYLFLKLRSVSVGETTEVGIKCKECGGATKQSIDISTVEVVKSESHNNKIKLDDNLMFIMKYPDVDNISLESSFDDVVKMVSESVDTIFYGEEGIKITDAEKEDLVDIINNLSSKHYKLLMEFFETMPKLRKDVTFTCEHCKTENKIALEGLADFF